MLCQNCGKENSDNGNYCENCGYLIKKDNQEHKKRDRIINTISVIMMVFESAYCIWYIFCGLKIVATSNYMLFNVLPIFIINIFILIFFMIKYRNIVAMISFYMSLIIIIIIPIMYISLFSGTMFLSWMRDTCTVLCSCGEESSSALREANLDFLRAFEFAIKIR